MSDGTASTLGPVGRLGRFAATHRRRVFVAWAIVAVGLGVLAPRVETALSGAGWQANGSESAAARAQIDRAFAGAGSYALQVAVHSEQRDRDRPRLPPHAGPRRADAGREPRGDHRDPAAPRRSRSPGTATPR